MRVAWLSFAATLAGAAGRTLMLFTYLAINNVQGLNRQHYAHTSPCVSISMKCMCVGRLGSVQWTAERTRSATNCGTDCPPTAHVQRQARMYSKNEESAECAASCRGAMCGSCSASDRQQRQSEASNVLPQREGEPAAACIWTGCSRTTYADGCTVPHTSVSEACISWSSCKALVRSETRAAQTIRERLNRPVTTMKNTNASR
eukprot:scaffold3473_cov122-Isochrysis_galbana.AAC.10